MDSFVEKDRKKYQRALDRARELGFSPYIEQLETIVTALEKIQMLDLDFFDAKGDMSEVGL